MITNTTISLLNDLFETLKKLKEANSKMRFNSFSPGLVAGRSNFLLRKSIIK